MKNGLMIQAFEWYLSNNGEHWTDLKNKINEFKELGINAVWIPPPYKGSAGSDDVGYGVYDIWDLGEFDQKNSTRTKYGTKQQLEELVNGLKAEHIIVYCDVVLNHKMGGDKKQKFKVVKVDRDDRNKVISDPFNIESWTQFDFEGRQDKYSKFKWVFQHFTACDYDAKSGNEGIFKIQGDDKDFSENVDEENGNYDFLMGMDIDHAHPDVKEELLRWCDWIIETLQLDGFRLDALKHIDTEFIKALVDRVNQKKKDFYLVGEYWKDDLQDLKDYVDVFEGKVNLFDVPLHFNFMQASKGGNGYDLSKIFDNTLVQINPINAVTFVDNHDSQPGQSLESWVEDWFKLHAYALILLRKDGYPCLFYGDLYGTHGDNATPAFLDKIKILCQVRDQNNYGEQFDYFDHGNTIAWLRKGDDEHKHGLVVVMGNSDAGFKEVDVGHHLKDSVWVDKLGHYQQEVVIGEDGIGKFYHEPGSVSVYVQKV